MGRLGLAVGAFRRTAPAKKGAERTCMVRHAPPGDGAGSHTAHRRDDLPVLELRRVAGALIDSLTDHRHPGLHPGTDPSDSRHPLGADAPTGVQGQERAHAERHGSRLRQIRRWERRSRFPSDRRFSRRGVRAAAARLCGSGRRKGALGPCPQDGTDPRGRGASQACPTVAGSGERPDRLSPQEVVPCIPRFRSRN